MLSGRSRQMGRQPVPKVPVGRLGFAALVCGTGSILRIVDSVAIVMTLRWRRAAERPKASHPSGIPVTGMSARCWRADGWADIRSAGLEDAEKRRPAAEPPTDQARVRLALPPPIPHA